MNENEKLTSLEHDLNACTLPASKKESYDEIRQRITQSQRMPIPQLLKRAKKIKPLVRLDPEDLSHAKDTEDEIRESDLLCFCEPVDIRKRSYLYEYNAQRIVMNQGSPLVARIKEKVGEFVCYHETGTFYGYLMPSVDEVLQQLPDSIDWHKVDAFELVFRSLDFPEVYDSVLDRHVSKVILYRLENRLPAKMRHQTVIFNGIGY